MSLLPLFPIIFLLHLLSSSSASPYELSYYIDCGGLSNTTDGFGTTWLSDRFYSGGSNGIVSEPLQFRHPQEKTLRYFSLSSGKKNCYSVPVPDGRYYVRTFTVYDNYDGRSHTPSFDASVEGTLVYSWRSPWSESHARGGAYSDLLSYVSDGHLDVCFYSIATDAPVVGSLQINQIDPLSYDSTSIGKDYLLVNYGRFTCGSNQWGPGFTNDTDLFGRSWQSGTDFRHPTSPASVQMYTPLSTPNSISGANVPPNYFPMKLYQTAVTIGEDLALEYQLPVDAKLDYLVWFHFVEINPTVTKAGQRVFDVVLNGKNVNRIDIYKEVGSFAAYTWHYVVKNLNTTTLSVRLVPVVGAPVLCGIENYALVPVDLSTVPEQVTAMRALKDSLRIPDRMGWNGDPCAPMSWEAWEGVTCRLNNNETALVVSQIDLGSQGLKGYISDQISLLTNLINLNLSTNSLGGPLPSGISQKSLVKLDLSYNQFTGSIPDGLASSSLQLLFLNDNLLEGRVQEELYSISVHGGTIDLSGNKGLCGVPPLPDCSLFWENGGLSTKGKIAVGLSCVVVFFVLLLVIYMVFIRKNRHDYDFGLPHDLISLAAKRNRYQRQKSLMHLEMESQHAKGLPSPLSPY